MADTRKTREVPGDAVRLISHFRFRIAAQPGRRPGQDWRGRAGLAVLIMAVCPTFTGVAADPQKPDRYPRLTALSPPGVSVGGRETWTLGGEDLGEVDRVEIEGDGVSAVIKAKSAASLTAEVRAEPGATPGFRAVRAEGPNGITNLRVIRVDRLVSTRELEPNDAPDQATRLPRGSAGVGELTPGDVDHFRLDGRKGERVTVDLEARRLGLAIAPVVTVLSADGHPLFQGRETPGVEGDCRFLYTFPENGSYLIQVRDNLFGGSEKGSYRLRVTDEPFATGLFPLGGSPGRPFVVTASGGNLAAPVIQTVDLPDRPGAVVDLPPFVRDHDRVLAPGRLVVGDGPEVNEAGGVMDLPEGVTVNGRIGKPGEVDRFRVGVKAGQTVRFRVVAAPLGSWLDSVVTVRDSRGTRLAENDDKPDARSDPDSRLEFRADSDDALTLELTDRFGQGGPEYAYRLTSGPARPDFAVHVREANSFTELSSWDSGILDIGAYPLPPGGGASILCDIVPEGRLGPITLRVEGLPEKIRSSTVTVYPQISGNMTGSRPGVPRGVLTLRAAPGSMGVSGRFRVKASTTLADGRILERVATDDVWVGSGPLSIDTRPVVVRRIREFPVRVTAP